MTPLFRAIRFVSVADAADFRQVFFLLMSCRFRLLRRHALLLPFRRQLLLLPLLMLLRC